MIETLERRKEAMVASLWANSNYDDDKGTRQKIIADIEENFDEAMNSIVGGTVREEEIDKSNPFYSAMQRGVDKVQGTSRVTDKNVEEVIEEETKETQEDEFSKYIDQS